MDSVRLYAQCHCRRQTLHCDIPRSRFPLENWACHCDDCRHITGPLFADYVILPRDLPNDAFFDVHNPPLGLSSYKKKGGRITWHFCSHCGAHIIQSQVLDDGKRVKWDLSQGTTYPLYLDDGIKIAKRVKHAYVKNGRDQGGASRYLPDGIPRYIKDEGEETPEDEKPSTEEQEEIDRFKAATTLPLSCACGRVQLTVHRPSSRPIDEKWKSSHKDDGWGWNFCLCDSCRTTSGFDGSCFFFLPYTHIDGPPGSEHATDGLRLYESYHNTRRWFCSTYGTSVFYDNFDRGNLTDVFPGLINAPLAGVFDSWLHQYASISYWYDARDKEYANCLAKGVCPDKEMPQGPSDPSKLAKYKGVLQL